MRLRFLPRKGTVLIQGFKEFIMRGNVIELAIAVVIGTAFTNIVTAFTEKIINPMLAVMGSSDVQGLGIELQKGNPATFVDFGAVISAAINFLIVALVVYFLLVVPMNKMAEIQKRRAGIAEDVPAPTTDELLIEIRDLLAQNGTTGTTGINKPQV